MWNTIKCICVPEHGLNFQLQSAYDGETKIIITLLANCWSELDLNLTAERDLVIQSWPVKILSTCWVTGPVILRHTSCSAQLIMKFIRLCKNTNSCWTTFLLWTVEGNRLNSWYIYSAPEKSGWVLCYTPICICVHPSICQSTLPFQVDNLSIYSWICLNLTYILSLGWVVCKLLMDKILKLIFSPYFIYYLGYFWWNFTDI